MNDSYVLQLKTGNEACFEEIYYQYNRLLFAYFYKRLQSTTICEDLIQETFIRLWKYRSRLDPALPLNIQLFRIARTALIDVARKKAKMPVSFVPDENLPEVVEEDAIHVTRDKKERLQYLIASLPPVRKKILTLKINGYSNKEIASQLTITVKTVENNINTAYRELRRFSELAPCLLLVLFCQS